jgi:hypothetical protein
MYKTLLIITLIFVSVFTWGYWHVSTHGVAYVRIDDAALKTDNLSWQLAPEVTVIFKDINGNVLAKGVQDEKLGTITFEHPDIGNCYKKTQGHGKDWRSCFDSMAKWVANWFPHIHYADVSVGKCTIKQIPVAVKSSLEDWWLWWVPHPHIGGIPYTYFNVLLVVDSDNCIVVKDLNA